MSTAAVQNEWVGWLPIARFVTANGFNTYVAERLTSWVVNPRLGSPSVVVGTTRKRTTYLVCQHHLLGCTAEAKTVTESVASTDKFMHGVILAGRVSHSRHPPFAEGHLEAFLAGLKRPAA
ncbi:hypothetical protein ACQ4LE_006720 [Meloidogyne hapla]